MKRFTLLNLIATLAIVTAGQYCAEEEAAYIREQENNAPSPAPSISLECTTQTSNARGRYTSTVSPCTFEFHKAEEHRRELDLIRFHTSDLCSSENSFLTVREYVDNFPDECVADFQRCYSLEHHRSVIWDFLCTKGWDIPEGTTHVSVDCQRDKELIMQATTHRREEMIRGEQHARVETYEKKLFNLAGILGVCLVGVYAISNLIVKPLVATRLHATTGGSCENHNNHSNQDILPRTIIQQPRYQLLHTASGSVGGGSSSLSEGAVVYGGEHPPQIMIMGAEEDGEASSELNESQLMEDFNSQVPDFDAVPITFHPPGAPHRAHSDLTTDSAVLPMTHPSLSSTITTTAEQESSSSDSIQAAAASIISSARSATRRSSSNNNNNNAGGPTMELELVSMVPEPDDIPIVPATILYS
mmetsp:Transcript_2730/g.6390  ORF Transcript_2730/g.6390 Transcript_2730/m.6390 type:complete len:416 (+) Transcript_2730:393-1640(+)|eukprot:CAMPEP_0113625226 /NCGR_PEP_ID=MMETSP0017_2-20120614/13029_1 /TAXON_ID=2856 /ORGANISM="Cylindrotheca closterium" /LENGTH=415 /DNA_ID=CAMNT_0000535331 /DNA_START=328 /DNA_END=1575 /DNA_ORIENTATION=- /assembly_acc=CAM_ASM_000147